MKLCIVKPDLYFFEQYNDMMKEWIESGTQIAPWFLNKPFDNLEDFAEFIQMLDNCEKGNLDKKFSSTSSYFVTDENDKLIGSASLRHYLTAEGYNTWGHIGYGVRPSERRKGYGVQILKMTLEEAGRKKIRKALVSSHTSNIGSVKVIESCGGTLENIVADPYEKGETISRYWFDIEL